MNRKFMVLDTEANGIVNRDNDVRGSEMRVYDLGFIVADKEGIIYDRASMVDVARLCQRDTYTNTNARFVESAYYAEKLPRYWDGMKSGEWEPCTFYDMRKRVWDACKEWGIKQVWAYNARFDCQALNSTICEESNGYTRFFLPYGVEWRDIWSAAGESILNTKKYVKWCYDHGYTTKSGNPTTNAETVYRYLIGDDGFIEAHTALQDCEVELAILLKVLKAKKRKPKKLGNGWRNPAALAKDMGFK